MFTEPFRRQAPVQPQPVVNTQTPGGPAANVSSASDVGPAARPPEPKPGHFEFDIQPKSDIQEKFLTSCAGLQDGVIKANLDEAFWSWIKKADPSLIAQAYMDGTLLSNEYRSVIADTKKLILESDTKADLEKLQGSVIDLDKEESNHNIALDKLEAFQNAKISKGCPSLHLASKSEKQEFATKTGGDFKQDYALYTRAFKFGTELIRIANLGSCAKSNTELHKTIATSKQERKRTLAITMKRLEIAHTASTSQRGW
jgi:hypothetical protein